MLGELITGVFNWFGGKDQRKEDNYNFNVSNEFNRAMQEDSQTFNAEQAELARLFNREESALSRAWNAEQAQIGRDFSSAEALAARMFNAEQAGIGRTFSAREAQLQHQRNAEEAEKNRLFQERMSNTQYQRAAADMQAAGFNPMLAYSQGGAGNVGGSTASSQAASAPVASGPAASASTASGSAASGPSASSGSTHAAGAPRASNIFGAAANSAISAFSTLAGVDQLEASTAKTLAEASAVATQVELWKSQAGLNTAEKAEIDQRVAETLHWWKGGFTQSRYSNKAMLEAQQVARGQYSQDMGEIEKERAEEGLKQDRMATEYLGYERPARFGESKVHELLNRELVGGATSASLLRTLLLEGLKGAISPPRVTNIYRR